MTEKLYVSSDFRITILRKRGPTLCESVGCDGIWFIGTKECRRLNIPFLEVANFVSDKPYSHESVSLPSLIGYLKQAHEYFLDFNLPPLRRKLIEAIDCSGSNDIANKLVRIEDIQQ